MQVCTGKCQRDVSWQLSCCLFNLNNVICNIFLEIMVQFSFPLSQGKLNFLLCNCSSPLPCLKLSTQSEPAIFTSAAIHCFHFSGQTISFTWQQEKIFPPSKDEWATGLGQWQTHTGLPFLSSPATGCASKNESRLKMLHSGFAG